MVSRPPPFAPATPSALPEAALALVPTAAAGVPCGRVLAVLSPRLLLFVARKRSHVDRECARVVWQLEPALAALIRSSEALVRVLLGFKAQSALCRVFSLHKMFLSQTSCAAVPLTSAPTLTCNSACAICEHGGMVPGAHDGMCSKATMEAARRVKVHKLEPSRRAEQLAQLCAHRHALWQVAHDRERNKAALLVRRLLLCGRLRVLTFRLCFGGLILGEALRRNDWAVRSVRLGVSPARLHAQSNAARPAQRIAATCTNKYAA